MDVLFKVVAQTSPQEWAAVFFTAVCIMLAGRNSIHTWWTGIVACFFYAWVFYGAKLYADMTLQGFFVITSLMGWFGWAYNNVLSGRSAPPENASRSFLVTGLLVGVIGAFSYGALLHYTTDAFAPFIDSFVLTLSILAQILLMRRNVETWPVWIVVNILSIPLYFSRELYLSSALYSFCLCNAIWSWTNWRALMRKG